MFKIGNDKHYRMTEESLKFIEMRDKQKYPKESLFVNAAIQYFGRGIEQENLMDELAKIGRVIGREYRCRKKRTLWKTRFPKIDSKGWMRWIG